MLKTCTMKTTKMTVLPVLYLSLVLVVALPSTQFTHVGLIIFNIGIYWEFIPHWGITVVGKEVTGKKVTDKK